VACLKALQSFCKQKLCNAFTIMAGTFWRLAIGRSGRPATRPVLQLADSRAVLLNKNFAAPFFVPALYKFLQTKTVTLQRLYNPSPETKTLQRLFLSQPFTGFCKQKLCSAFTIPALNFFVPALKKSGLGHSGDSDDRADWLNNDTCDRQQFLGCLFLCILHAACLLTRRHICRR